MSPSQSTPKRWHNGVLVSPVRKPFKPKPKPKPDFLAAELPKAHGKLQKFWRAIIKGKLNRLELLKIYSRLKVQADSSYQSRRDQRIRLEEREMATCFSCERFRKIARHHIIQLQHGGPNRNPNIVYLCHYCHAEIHPWLHRKSLLPK